MDLAIGPLVYSFLDINNRMKSCISKEGISLGRKDIRSFIFQGAAFCYSIELMVAYIAMSLCYQSVMAASS